LARGKTRATAFATEFTENGKDVRIATATAARQVYDEGTEVGKANGDEE